MASRFSYKQLGDSDDDDEKVKTNFAYKPLVESEDDDEEDEGNIYYEQMKPILSLIWNLEKMYELSPNERFMKLVNKLGEIFLLQHYWKRADVLVNLEHAMGGHSTIKQNSFGENILDFNNVARQQLKPYIQEFLNQKLYK